MSIRRFIINPPKNMTEKSVTEAAEKMFAALKGTDIGSPIDKPLEPSRPVLDAAESVDAVEPADGKDEGEVHSGSGDEGD